MLDKDRIMLMTRMASYENTEGKKMIRITDYFRGDYVAFGMLKTAVAVTISFLTVVGIYIFCNADRFIAEFYETDFQFIIRKMLMVFAVVIIFYLMIAFILYSYRYTQARKSVRVYRKALKKLISMYGR
ncbi:MAG: hypothetical protein K5894_00755 [Lachnospiraceae bacterium]|nr:hypothetical protein [Lachnospiraceae bacterium]